LRVQNLDLINYKRVLIKECFISKEIRGREGENLQNYAHPPDNSQLPLCLRRGFEQATYTSRRHILPMVQDSCCSWALRWHHHMNKDLRQGVLQTVPSRLAVECLLNPVECSILFAARPVGETLSSMEK